MSLEKYAAGSCLQTLKAAVFAAIVCVLCAVVTSVIARFVPLSEGVLKGVGAAVKILSLAIGVLLFIHPQKAWLKGCLAGVLFTLLTYFLFSAVSGGFIGVALLLKLLLGGVTGLLCGLLSSLFKR